MDREEIIRMAREAGAYAPRYPIGPHDVQFSFASLEIFFQAAYAAGTKAESDRIAEEAKHIIKRAEARGAAAEREACASICFQEAPSIDGELIAAAIRARGEKA
jgi:hypothetical protein